MRRTAISTLSVRCGRALQRLGRWLASSEAIAREVLPPWADDLEEAVERNELSLVYQPKLNLRTDRIDGVEALLRWHHPQWGAISPAEFVPIAEQRNQIAGVTRWMIGRTLADQAALTRAGLKLQIAINLSGRLVADACFTAWMLKHCAGAADALTMEITETAVIDDPRRALDNLHAYAAAGVRIAIDDYGAGLSSLAYLKQLPARELKIDRLFIQGLTSSHRDPLLVRSTIDLAHALEMEVTAEGVETAMALSLLRVMGCDHAQGFYIARPKPLNELRAFLAGFDGIQAEAATLLPAIKVKRDR